MAFKEVSRWRQWASEKLNPAQPSIAASEAAVYPESVIEYEQAYDEIEVIHRAVEMIVNGCVEMPVIVEGSGPTKKLNKLFNIQPNPFEDRVRMFSRAFLDFILDGNAFFYYDGTYIYCLPANDVVVVPDKRTFVSHYEYIVTQAEQSTFYSFAKPTQRDDSIRFETNEIIHVMAENSDSIFRGTSKLRSIKRLLELYYFMINFQKQFFKNNAVPGFVLTTENILSKRAKERLLEAWKSTYTTIFDGARNPAILDGGLKIDPFSNINFSTLDFESSIERIQQDMTKALGVPYILLKSGNNANIDQNQKLFYLHTVIPTLNKFCSAFAHFFNNDVIIRPDRLAVPALQPDNKTQATYYSSLVNTGIITPDEARKGLRFPALGGDMNNIRIPQNITGSAVDATLGGRPVEGEESSTQEENTNDK